MKPRIAIICSVLLLAAPFSASAQSLAEQGIVGSVGVGALYGATKGLNKPPANPVVDAVLRQQGYTNIGATSDPSQFTALDTSQGRVLVTIDPSTFAIKSVEPR